ncbi:MAG: SusC/RagA family TonB-linked outer membrane protein [Cytophagales bacterium]|nr:SusC/RagA family TonB-linked outer membrane protein [Cytophagales bacterium]
MKKNLLRMMLAVVFFGGSHWVSAQKTISGKVTDASNGEALPGVSVVVKGTTIGTSTDDKGKYTLEVPSDSSIVTFSFIGMNSSEVTVGSQTTIDVALIGELMKLMEVVVTAVGIEKDKRSIAYAQQTVQGDELVKSRETNIVNAINGKVAGVQIYTSSGAPGASSTIKIRGNNSITLDNGPLFVVDGVPIDNSENVSSSATDANTPFTEGVGNSNRAIDINPNDIENISVLKGPAATMLYGTRGGNGVVMITTKKGKAGIGTKPTFTFSSSLSMDQVNKLPELQNKYGQGDGGVYEGPETRQSASFGPRMDTMYYDNTVPYAYDKNGALVGKSSAPAGAKQANIYNNPNQFFKTGITSDISFSMAGGNEKSTYYASYSRNKSDGVVPNSNFERNSIRINAETYLTKYFKASASINYINSGGQRVQQGSNTSGLMLGLLRTPVSFDNSNGATDYKDESAYVFADGTQRNYRGGRGYDNPYWTINRNPYKDVVNRIIGNTTLEYSITNWLKVLYRGGVDFSLDNRNGAWDIGSRAHNLGRVIEDNISTTQINHDFIVNINRDLTKDLALNVNLGTNYFTRKFSSNYTQGDNMVIPKFYSISNTTSFQVIQNKSEKQIFGIYGDAILGYQKIYYLNLGSRIDWSSTLPVDNNAVPYYNASLGVVVTEMLSRYFGVSSNIVNYGKLRLSYGAAGRDAPAYSTKTIYGQPLYNDGYTNGIQFPVNGTPGFGAGTSQGSTQPVLGNDKLKSELNTTFEIGADLEFLKSRIKLDFTYYSARNTRGIVLVPIPSSTGFQYVTANTGVITNQGVEVLLTLVPLQTSSFNWTSTINYSLNRSNVEDLGVGIDNIFLNGFTGSGSYAVKGQQYGVFYGGKWLRDSQGRIVVDNTGHPIVDPNQGVISNPNAKYTVGWRNSLSYKGITFSFLMDFRQGGQVWNGTRGALVFFGTAKETEQRGDSVLIDGVVADANGNPTDVVNTKKIVKDQDWYQGNGGGFGNQAESFVEDASWIRCRDMSLSYQLPKSLLEKSKFFRSVEFGIYARNLFLITAYKGIDPETNLTGTGNGFGLDYFNMPNTKSYGVNLKFIF